MAQNATRKKPVGSLFVMGILSIAMYTALLSYQDQVMSMFGKGGYYAFLPIITAFAFSVIHGSFTGNFWTVLGIEAARKKKEGN
jgi:hypothetical protein